MRLRSFVPRGFSRWFAAATVAVAAGLCADGVHALDPTRRASEYSSLAFTVDDGLPHNSVHTIRQGPDGYLWLGTWEGAVRFDGMRFTVYDSVRVPEMASDGVRALAFRPDGELLMGVEDGGLVAVGPQGSHRIGGAALLAVNVSSLVASTDGAIWIGTTDQGVLRLDPNESIQRFDAARGLASNSVRLIMPDGDAMLVGSARGLDRIRDGTIESLGRAGGLPISDVLAAVRGRDGVLRVGGSHGLWRLEQDRFVRESWVPEVIIQSLLEDRDGSLWVATSGNGLLRYRDGRVELLDTRVGLQGVGIATLFEDNEGLLWVGTTSGLVRVTDGPVSALDRIHGLPDVYVRSVLEDRHGQVWVGTGNGLHGYPEGDWLSRSVRHGFSGRSILSLAESDADGLWVGTYSAGLHERGGSARAYTTATGLVSDQIRAILPVPGGGLWLGTPSGLQWVDDQGPGRVLRVADGLPSNFVRTLQQGPGGQLWVGTGEGVAVLGADSRLVAIYGRAAGHHFGDVFDIRFDDNGDVCLATDSGLAVVRQGRVSLFDQRHGLPDDTIFRILADTSDNLWLSSNRGVFRLTRADLRDLISGHHSRVTPLLLTSIDGMPSTQSNGGSAPAGWRTRRGTLWFPTASGVAIVHPEAVERMRRGAVPTVVEELHVDGVARPLFGPLDVEPGAKRVGIVFTALSYRAPSHVRYRFRLVGYDEDWVDPEGRTTAIYTNLPPGAYRFEVQALHWPSQWEDAVLLPPASLAFNVLAPFWRQTWFILLGVGLFAALLATAHRRRTSVVRERERVRVVTASERRYRDLFQMSLGLICVHTLDGTLKQVNPAVSRLLGFPAEQIVGKRLQDLVPKRQHEAVKSYLERIAAVGEDRGLLMLTTSDGTMRALQYHNKIYRDAETPYVIGHAQDVTERVRQETELQEQGIRDSLTGAYNRRYLARFDQHGTSSEWATIVIDLDLFKQINDTYGHQRGDEVLLDTVKFLHSVVRPGDAIVRLGGDEFLVFVPMATAAEMDGLSNRIRAEAAERAPCGFSLGWALRENGEPLEATLARADQVLYTQKQTRRPAAGLQNGESALE